MHEPPVDPRPLVDRIGDLALDQIDDIEAANEACYRAGITDGLPVIPPTARRIERMLGAMAGSSTPGLGPLPPGFVTPTNWDAAACAVMAGCEVGALPVVLAGLSAVADPVFNLLGIQTTTGGAAPLFILNGPQVGALGVNAGHNSLGPGWRPNASIGRALRLVLQNVGMAVPGTGDMATQGHPGKYTWLVAENEAASPWQPFHTLRGFRASDSTVTAVGGVGNVEVVLSHTTVEELADTMARSMAIGNPGRGYYGSGQPLWLLPPESAEFLVREGWDRARLQQELYERSRVPLSRLHPSIAQRAATGREMALGESSDATTAHSPDDILIVVTGGVGYKATFVPTWGGGTTAVTRTVEVI